MSWGFEFVAKSKEKAKAEIDRFAAQQSCLPSEIAGMMKDRIDTMPEPAEDRAMYVQSNGHIDGAASYGYSNGEAKFRITIIGFLVALLLALFAAPTFAEDNVPGVGCLSNHPRTCFAPTVSVNFLRVPFNDPKLVRTFSPSVGYGVVFKKGAWYETGINFGLGLRDSDGAPLEPSLSFSFANYARIGVAGTVGGDTSFVRSLGIIFNLGFSP